MSDRSIWKYEVPVADLVSIEAPMPAQLLHVEATDQGQTLLFWFIVTPGASRWTRTYRVIGTGHTAVGRLEVEQHVATVLSGPFVWHVFEPA